MAGMTEKGFTTKRQHEIISDGKSKAVEIFQDLVPPGDVVDTSDSSTIGRFIGLNSVPLADLWEAAQQVYLAFDPNSATGIPLDNLVMYAGLTRNPAFPTTATVVVWGDENTTILSGSVVRAIDNTFYDTITTISLTRDQNIGFRVGIPSVVSGETYGFIISLGNASTSITYEALPSDDATSILSELESQLSAVAGITAAINSDSLVVEVEDIFVYMSVVPINMNILKIKSRTGVVNQEVGFKEQEANTINAIATPILGWDSVNNPFPAVPGGDIETDDELRLRFRNSKFIRAQNISDALYSALLDIDGVIDAAIYENESGTYDPVYDLPGHSFKPIVLGGNPIEIARAIWRNKPLGIASHGNTYETIEDSQGFQRDIYFERPVPQPIYITINLTVDGNFPANGADAIKNALISYFSEEFSIGEDVIYSRLYTPINSVQGHQVDSLYIGTSPSPTGTSNIPIAFNEIASLSTSNIVINT